MYSKLGNNLEREPRLQEHWSKLQDKVNEILTWNDVF